MKPVLGIIGAGRVGGLLARLCWHAGYKIGGVASRSAEHATGLAALVDAPVMTIDTLPDHCDLVLLTVPDDSIPAVVEILKRCDWRGHGIVHTSGSLSMDVLQPLIVHGARVGSLHPAYPITSSVAEANLQGVVFATEAGDSVMQGWLSELVGVLQGREIQIAAGQKPAYHAAMVIASNYTVTLYAVAERMLQAIGASREDADAALNSLLTGTLVNIHKQGIPEALTGPLVRGDVGTIRAHLEAIDDPLLRDAYRDLARLSYPMLIQRGIDPTAIESMLRDTI